MSTIEQVRSLIVAGLENSLDVAEARGAGLDWHAGYRAALHGLLMSLPEEPPVDETFSLELKLADCLADAIDTPIMKVRDVLGGPEIELCLRAWLPEISERAAVLLEEAGR